MKDSKGWDGKLRVESKATITNPEALEDPDYSDSDAPPVEEIEADEGELLYELGRILARRKENLKTNMCSFTSDLLEDEDKDVEVCCALRNNNTKPQKLMGP